jgi:hypothetical protein
VFEGEAHHLRRVNDAPIVQFGVLAGASIEAEESGTGTDLLNHRSLIDTGVPGDLAGRDFERDPDDVDSRPLGSLARLLRGIHRVDSPQQGGTSTGHDTFGHGSLGGRSLQQFCAGGVVKEQVCIGGHIVIMSQNQVRRAGSFCQTSRDQRKDFRPLVAPPRPARHKDRQGQCHGPVHDAQRRELEHARNSRNVHATTPTATMPTRIGSRTGFAAIFRGPESPARRSTRMRMPCPKSRVTNANAEKAFDRRDSRDCPPQSADCSDALLSRISVKPTTISAKPTKATGPVCEPVLGRALVGATVARGATMLAPSTPDCVVGTTTVVVATVVVDAAVVVAAVVGAAVVAAAVVGAAVVAAAVVGAAVVGAAVVGAAVVGAAVVGAAVVGASVLPAVVEVGAHHSTGRFTVAEFGAVSPLDQVATSETGKLASESERPDAVPLTAFAAGMTVPLASPENRMPDGVVTEVNVSALEASSLVIVRVACQLCRSSEQRVVIDIVVCQAAAGRAGTSVNSTAPTTTPRAKTHRRS